MLGKYKNATEIRIIKGVPAIIQTDSFGDVLTVEPALNTDNYAVRNYLYQTDKVVYEKFINNDFKHATIDRGLISTVKGKSFECAESLFK